MCVWLRGVYAKCVRCVCRKGLQVLRLREREGLRGVDFTMGVCKRVSFGVRARRAPAAQHVCGVHNCPCAHLQARIIRASDSLCALSVCVCVCSGSVEASGSLGFNCHFMQLLSSKTQRRRGERERETEGERNRERERERMNVCTPMRMSCSGVSPLLGDRTSSDCAHRKLVRAEAKS